MAELILKPDPDADLYVTWHTGSDGPGRSGTRAEMLGRWYAGQEDRFDRADTTGTSELGGHYGWAHKGAIYDQLGWLPAEHWEAFFHAHHRGDEIAKLLLLVDFEDDHDGFFRRLRERRIAELRAMEPGATGTPPGAQQD